ncbi:glycosyltransferase family 2 protein [Vallitalea okinawensis]|uniref:glycosyltransferase family 2 protein n=1 Tax=Vallitalea okinawensis TaxID=2078660 RepID=UPI000CFDDB60|nr:glycosyltransferase family 2 protein [Vallitalea okinawensis]
MVENIIDYINQFFMYYIFVYAVIFFISTIYAINNLYQSMERKKYRNNLRVKNDANYVPISILVPAYNEEKTVVECISSILSLNYPEYEIVIINDGSSDNTEEVLIEEFNLHKVMRPIRRLVNSKNDRSIYEGGDRIKITLINKENGGKADALNLGINASRYPFFVSLDADSILQKDSLSNIVIPFMEDDRTIAVGGNIKVSNQIVLQNGEVAKVLTPKKWLIIMQMIEYYRVFLTTRVWFNQFNGNLIISGAFGLFKKDAVINVGGYDTQHIGEDMSLVVKMHSFYRKNKLSYRIQYAPNAICWSQVPERISDFKKQRRRWHIGLMQSLFEHKYIFLNTTYGLIGTFSFLYYLIYEMLSCVLDIVGVTFIILAYYTGFINIQFFVTFFVVYIGYSFVISAAAIILESYVFKDILNWRVILKLIFYSLIESLGYRQISSLYRLSALFQYRKRKHEWEKINRQRHHKVES